MSDGLGQTLYGDDALGRMLSHSRNLGFRV